MDQNEVTANGQTKKDIENVFPNLLTEDEQNEIFAKMIIDIYLNSEYENEKI